MRKLSLVLLAIVFILGLAVQAGAVVTEVSDSAFTGDEPITFYDDDGDGVSDFIRGDAITTQYEARGVVFAEGWYWEDFFGGLFWEMKFSAGNINPGNNYETTPTPIRMNFVEPVTRVGFDILSLEATEIIVNVYRDGAETGSNYQIIYPDTDSTFVGVDDPEGIDAIAVSADGVYSLLTDFVVIDNLMFGGTPDTGPEIIPAKVDIKPGNCMNPLNIRSRGVLRVAILTDENLDATLVDPTTVLLMGVAPLAHDLEFVAECSSDNPNADDLDLTLKFDTAEIVKAIGDVNDGDVLTLQLTGKLYDGTEIAGGDAVAILAKTKQKKHWKKRWKKHSKKHSKKHWKEHSKEHPKKHWFEKLKEKWKAFKTKWKSKR